MFENNYLQGIGLLGLAAHEVLNNQDFKAGFDAATKALALFHAQEALENLVSAVRAAKEAPEIRAALAPKGNTP